VVTRRLFLWLSHRGLAGLFDAKTYDEGLEAVELYVFAGSA